MKTRLALLVVAGLCFYAGGAFTEAQPDDQGVQTTTGTVVSARDASLVITTDSGVERTFSTSETTLMPLTALVAGDRVSVKFRVVGAGRPEAVDVSIIDPGPGTAGITLTPPAKPASPATANVTLMVAFVCSVALAAALAVQATRLL